MGRANAVASGEGEGETYLNKEEGEGECQGAARVNGGGVRVVGM